MVSHNAHTVLVTGSGDGTVRLWDPDSCQQIHEPLTGHPEEVYAVAAVPWPDGRSMIASGGEGGTVRLWDPSSGLPVGRPFTARHRTLPRGPSAVLEMAAFSTPNARPMLATSGGDTTVRLWDPLTGHGARHHWRRLLLDHAANVD